MLCSCAALPPSLLLQGTNLRNDINNRLQNITRITTERWREHAAERRTGRGVSGISQRGPAWQGVV